MLPHSLTLCIEKGTVGAPAASAIRARATTGSAMKIWIKLLLGSLIGLALALLLPATVQGILDAVSDVLLGIGRYAIFPLVFFSVGVGVSELRQEKRLLRVYVSIVKYLAVAAAVLVLIGVVSVLIFPPERVPIAVAADHALQPVNVLDGLKAIFPRNLFTVLGRGGEFLLPVVVLAFLLGVNLDFDRLLTRPIAQLFDSLSRIFYHLNSLVVELLGIAMIAIAAAWIMRVAQAGPGTYRQILIIMAVDVALVAFGVFPGALSLLGVRNPYRWLYAALGPGLVGLFAGDQYLAIGVLSKHGKESLGVPRSIGSSVYAVSACLGRAGSAMVAAVSFMLVLRSYSQIEISFLQVLWVIGFSFLVSFVLGAVPGSGAYYAVFMLCSLYGKGLQEGYLVLKAIAPLVVAFGAFIDVLASAFISLLIAREENVWSEVETENFI
jgi:aerobic C4-dicarboxylate transport protein